jgi:ribulose-5-phosphate 4-epimerase/fuculose-1-phosphate aldolase
MNEQTRFDVRSHVSEAEWNMRVDLAACYRLCDHYRWTDLLATHISARVPGEPHHFLINPFGLFFGEITASSLLKVDESGRILLPSPYPFNEAGFVIHGAIHEARPEVDCVLHLHTTDGIAVSALEEGLLPLSQTALVCIPKLAYHEYEGPAVNMEERARLCEHLGDKQLLILRNHGTLACGTSVAEAWVNIHHLERACSIQVRTMGAKRHMPSAQSIHNAATQRATGGGLRYDGEQAAPVVLKYSERVWPAALRMLDRIDSSYRD